MNSGFALTLGTPHAKVCIAVDTDRFLQLFVSRIRGK